MDGAGGAAPEEVRSLIEASWVIQVESARALDEMHRIRKAGAEPTELEWLAAHLATIATRLTAVLQPIACETIAGRWACGHGLPVCTVAALVRTINVAKAPTAAHVWRYLGLSGTNQPGPVAIMLVIALQRDLQKIDPALPYGALYQERLRLEYERPPEKFRQEFAARRVVRQFLAHYHAVAFYEVYHQAPESPYAFNAPEGDDRLTVPGWPF